MEMWLDDSLHHRTNIMEIKPICSKDDSSQIYSLPEDLIIEILVRLPVKSLLKFKSVSKSWCYLISGKQFAQSHLEFLTNNTACLHHNISLCEIHYPSNRCYMNFYPLNALLLGNPSKEDNVAHKIDCPLKDLRTARLLGSCNGLCCVLAKRSPENPSNKVFRVSECFFLWNPWTRMYRVLPSTDCESVHYVLDSGYGFVGGDYKVLARYNDRVSGKSIVELYSLTTDSWKRVNNFLPEDNEPNSPGKFVNRKLYWLKKEFVFYFDLESEVSGTVQLPEPVNGDNSIMKVLAECPCLHTLREHYSRTDLWILEKHGLEDESWNKITSIDHKSSPVPISLPDPVCMTREGEILLMYGRTHFIIYDPKSKCFRQPYSIESAMTNFASSVCIPSLISPFQDD